MAVFRPGDHGSTFGGNPLAAAAALEALDVMLEERFAERVAGRDVAERLVAHGVLTCDTHGTVIRFAPPLIATREQLDWAIERIRVCFDELDRGMRRAA